MNNKGQFDLTEISPGSMILAVVGIIMGFVVAQLMGAGLFLKILTSAGGAVVGFVWGQMASQ